MCFVRNPQEGKEDIQDREILQKLFVSPGGRGLVEIVSEGPWGRQGREDIFPAGSHSASLVSCLLCAPVWRRKRNTCREGRWRWQGETPASHWQSSPYPRRGRPLGNRVRTGWKVSRHWGPLRSWQIQGTQHTACLQGSLSVPLPLGYPVLGPTPTPRGALLKGLPSLSCGMVEWEGRWTWGQLCHPLCDLGQVSFLLASLLSRRKRPVR